MDAHNLFEYDGCSTKNLPPLARDTDVITSHEAAEKMVKSGALNKQEQEIYNDIRRFVYEYSHRNNFTAKELKAFGWDDHLYYIKVQRRLSGLHNKGKIERLNTEGGVYIEGQKLMKRDGCAVWRLK